jgi:hypothetical protein
MSGLLHIFIFLHSRTRSVDMPLLKARVIVKDVELSVLNLSPLQIAFPYLYQVSNNNIQGSICKKIRAVPAPEKNRITRRMPKGPYLLNCKK